MEDHTWMLSPHGKQKHMAQWVVDNYDGRPDYENHKLVQQWISASKQILQDPTTEERSSLYVESGE